MNPMEIFERAVRTKRSYGTTSEAEFVAWLANLIQPTMIDGAGNLHVDIGGASRTLFSCHTDTICQGEGVNPVVIEGDTWKASPGHSLGADDAAGIAICCALIRANVPGYYIFHRGEECGGIGSRWLAKEMPDFLGAFDHAIAFDRAGYTDVITHQGFERCCSDKFGQALADMLNEAGFIYMPSDEGVFTDTKNYVDLIPECTNISVGYFCQHGDKESQNITYLAQLLETLPTLDWAALPVERDPTEVEDTSVICWAGWRRDDWANEPLTYKPLNWKQPKKSKKVKVKQQQQQKVVQLGWFEDTQLDAAFEDALDEAISGHPFELLWQVAEHVCESDPSAVYNVLNEKRLDPEFMADISKIRDRVKVYEAVYDQCLVVDKMAQ